MQDREVKSVDEMIKEFLIWIEFCYSIEKMHRKMFRDEEGMIFLVRC